MRECRDCEITLACKQLRTRDCMNCTFYLYAISEPIIEMSTNITFACFNGGYPEQAEHMKEAGLDPSCNKWSMVFDFNDEAKTGNKAWLRRRLHAAIVRAHRYVECQPGILIEDGDAKFARFTGLWAGVGAGNQKIGLCRD